ncbi:MAG: tol-pal system-associated acyl-CoA thioesterase [Pseudomonadota bacterium]
MIHQMDIRVYYEDTDMAGIVYYANYLRFIERGRSSMLRDTGFSQNMLRDELDTVFAVTEVHAKYRRPARLDDLLTVETAIGQMTRARVVFEQTVKRKDEVLFEASVTVATMSLAGLPKALPETAREIFQTYQA